mgnify:CR=1 FL=1|tara:strand:+ start:5782 stop:7149 length:1368 start_codon:yes stop_codon:yes gene_type:complete
MGIFDRFRRQPVVAEQKPLRVGSNVSLSVAAGLPNIFEDTEKFQKDTNFINKFDLYDNMVKLDPELNGAVRSVSLTANNYRIDYKKAKNSQIRNSIMELVERIDLDDFLINAVRNLQVYGNDISKLVGRTGVGITNVQSLPIRQITIVDNRGANGLPFTADTNSPIMTNDFYILREQGIDTMVFPRNEIMHFRTDYRSNWYEDTKLRQTYGVWGQSRFSSLEQVVRVKYNTMNNRIALEDVLTKQFITIDKSAIEHITDPDEQAERLGIIMDEVINLFEGLRGDQMPILPSYVSLHHVDLKNTIPDNSNFLDTVGANVAAVLHVPRVAAGQEKGSTFAATYNANMWANTAIARLQSIVKQGIVELFSKQLDLMGIPHTKKDLPEFIFEPIAEESPMDSMKRAVLGWQAGMLTLNQSLDIIGEAPTMDGEMRGGKGNAKLGELPRTNQQEGHSNDE